MQTINTSAQTFIPNNKHFLLPPYSLFSLNIPLTNKVDLMVLEIGESLSSIKSDLSALNFVSL